MAHRDLTSQYLKLRSYYVKPQYTMTSPTVDGYDDDNDEHEIELNYMASHSPSVDLEGSPSDYMHRFNSPSAFWIGILHSVRDDIKLIDKKSMCGQRHAHTYIMHLLMCVFLILYFLWPNERMQRQCPI